MSARYFIENGDTISEPMSLDWDGGRVSFLFFDGAGDPATITGTPLVYITPYPTGDLWREVMLLSAGEWLFNGIISRVKVDLSGVAGFVTYRVVVSRSDDPIPMIPDGTFVGLRAITTQPYTEANVKNGLQFDLRANWPLSDVIGTLTSRKISFTTGAKTVLVKLREFQFIAEEMTLRLFKDPVITVAGTPLSINNYNSRNPVASTVTAAKNVTTSSDGTEFNAADYEAFFGTQANPQRVQSTALQGRERILLPNTTYLVVITNTGTGDARAEYHLDWYEGGTDLPIGAQ